MDNFPHFTHVHLALSIDRSAGGLQPAIAGLAEAQSRRGLTAMIWVVKDDEGQGEHLLNGSCVEFRLFSRTGPARLALSMPLLEAATLLRNTVVHLHGLWTCLSLAARLAVRHPTNRLVVHPHGMLSREALKRNSTLKRTIWLMHEHQLLKKASLVRCLSLHEQETVVKINSSFATKVVPNGVTLPPIAPGNETRHSRVLLFLGRIDPIKGLENLVHAWRVSEMQQHGWQLRIAGWGSVDYLESIRALIRQTACEPSIMLVGPVFGAVKSEEFARCTAFVLPSLSEALPMAAMEALAHGCPVLVTEACNLDAAAHAGAALLMEVNTPSIALALERLRGLSPDALKNMSAAARSFVENSFDWDVLAGQLETHLLPTTCNTQGIAKE